MREARLKTYKTYIVEHCLVNYEWYRLTESEVNKLTWFVRDDGRVALVESEEARCLAVAFVLGQPRVALEEVVLALGRHVHLHVLDEPPAAFHHAVVTQL